MSSLFIRSRLGLLPTQLGLVRVLLLVLLLAFAPQTGQAFQPQAVTYYVSSSAGSDANSGLSQSAPFATVSRVNSLALAPGDRVLFKCGDVWRTDPLSITRSGLAGQPVTFGSYPAGCADRPVLSGAQPVSGWGLYSENIYSADLAAGVNAGRFGFDVNQLFRGEQRLPLGRWPDLDAPDGGYSTVDGQPEGDRIRDHELPPGDWSGAFAHIRGMRWYILNRLVTSTSDSTLTLNAPAGCWGSCTGWGYFLNGHLNTLDREGEWYYDPAAQRLYLFSAGGPPADGEIEASVVLKDDDRSWGGINLGQDLQGSGIAHVVVENLEVRRWFRHGIASPTNLAHTENHDLYLRGNLIRDVDSTGINLMTWVYSAVDGRPDGWRGGYNLLVEANIIQVANRMGINTASRQSSFIDNVIQDVSLIANLGTAGMGCGLDDGEGLCTEDGDGFRIKVDRPADSGNTNTLRGNRLERIGYNGLDIFGHSNTIEHNVILHACYSKGDCGAVRTFGRDSLASTPLHDLVFHENIFVDIIGNTDGCETSFDQRFGFGFYIDNYSRDVSLTGNTVISATVHGALYQSSTGQVTGNTFYNNGRQASWSGQVWLTAAPSSLSAHTDNILFSLNPDAWTFSLESLSTLGASERNSYFHPYRADQIRAGGSRTLASWQAYSGKDASSREAWYTQSAGEMPRSRIFYNDSPSPRLVDLEGRQYLDLDQNPVWGSFSLAPYQSRILIDNGLAPLALLSLSPSILGVGEAADFTLTLTGAGFTPSSVVRWDGSDRPTTYLSSSRLQAAIFTVDVAAPGTFPVTVFDASIPPAGAETSTLVFRVVTEVSRVYLPLAFRP